MKQEMKMKNKVTKIYKREIQILKTEKPRNIIPYHKL